MDSDHYLTLLRSKLNLQEFMADELHLYCRYIDQIESNKINEPNIALEAVKAMSEAIFRHILSHPNIKTEYSAALTQKDAATVYLFKQAYLALADLDLVDIEIMESGKKYFHDISEVRNSIGLISHGKDLRTVDNLRKSSIELVISIATNHVLVMLEAYEKLLDEPEEPYENNVEFNKYLDTDLELRGVIYSKALYDQDIIAYKELLDEYNESQPEES